MDDNCGEWKECMGVASGCGEEEVGVASDVVVRRYIDFIILLILLFLYLFFLAAASLPFVHKKKCFSFLFQYFFVIKLCIIFFPHSINTHTCNYGHPTAAI